jgi:muramoyltetrapeptide carboxypeptidase LdcA involved in peptidoglycan recycling
MYFKGITGTTSALITGGLHILRAVNEEAYHIDRMFTHLRSASGDQLHKLEALVLGDFDRALQDVLKNGTSILSFFHTPAESLGFCERKLKLVRSRGI